MFLETCKIKPVCLSHAALLHSFIALFSMHFHGFFNGFLHI